MIWHTLLVILASAADHVQVSALYLLFLRETHSSTSILIHASTAVLAQLSALFQLSLRANCTIANENKKLRSESSGVFLVILYYSSWKALSLRTS